MNWKLVIAILLQFVNKFTLSKVFTAQVPANQIFSLKPIFIGRYWTHSNHPTLTGNLKIHIPSNYDLAKLPKQIKIYGILTPRYEDMLKFAFVNTDSDKLDDKTSEHKLTGDELLKPNIASSNFICKQFLASSQFTIPVKIPEIDRVKDKIQQFNFRGQPHIEYFKELKFDEHINIETMQPLHEKPRKQEISKKGNVQYTNDSESKITKKIHKYKHKNAYDLTLVMFDSPCMNPKDYENINVKAAGSYESVQASVDHFNYMVSSDLKIQYTIDIKSHSHAHCGHKTSLISYEELYIFELSIGFFFGYLAILVIQGYQMKKWKTSGLSYDLPLTLLGLSVQCQVISQVFRILHWSLVHYLGYEIWLVALITKLYHLIGDVVQTILLIFLAQGWGLLFKESFPKISMFVLPMSLTALRYIWTLVSFYFIRDVKDYHDYEGLTGYLDQIACMILGQYFVYSLYVSGMKKDQKYANFMKMIKYLGVFIFALRPAMILSVNFIVEKDWQLFFVFCWEFGSNLFAISVVGLALLAKNGSYKKIAISAGIFLDDEVLHLK